MDDDKYKKKLVKNIQMLATLVATATYAAAFNPPGGVWQDINDAYLPGDPIMRSIHHGRYVVFFYGNATAFAFSLAVVVITLLVTAHPKRRSLTKKRVLFPVILMSLMLVAMLALAAAYGAGACQDKPTVVWYCLLVPGPLVLFIGQIFALIMGRGSGGGGSGTGNIPVQATGHSRDCSGGGSGTGNVHVQAAGDGGGSSGGGSSTGNVPVQVAGDGGGASGEGSGIGNVSVQAAGDEEKQDKEDKGKDFRELMAPVSMFALTITYGAGLSTPGGFWDNAEGGHRPGDAILKDRMHGKVLRWFLLSNTLAFAASLYSVATIVVRRKTSVDGPLARFNSIVVVFGLLICGLLVAYTNASSRGHSSTGWLCEVALAYIVLHVAVYVISMKAIRNTRSWKEVVAPLVSKLNDKLRCSGADQPCKKRRRQAKLVQLMAGLAVAITYQAGLYPPGGLWPANADGHMAGDPILLTTNAKRYKGFYYCNTVSFVASLLAMFLAQKEYLHRYHALEAAMILDMLGLVGAYAIGSCRDQVSTLYVAGLAAAGVVYVFVHVSYFTLDDGNKSPAGASAPAPAPAPSAGGAGSNDEAEVEKKAGRFLLFAILVASITYQAGLTPPGGFLFKDDARSGHLAGDPVLHYNYPRRYRTFIYCNSVSFMLSIVLILHLINPTKYGPAMRSHALSVSSGVTYVCLMGAFAAGSSQHMTGSFYIFGLAAVAFFICLVISVWTYLQKGEGKEEGKNGTPSEESNKYTDEEEEKKKKQRIKNEYLVTLAILVASATYPTGLDPPGGSWQSSSGDGHDAGIPMMYDNRRSRYLAFFFSNTTSFIASIMLIHMLLPDLLLGGHHKGISEFFKSYRTGLKGLVSLQCIGFLVAYAAGSSRQWKTSVYTVALVIPVLFFVAMHVSLSIYRKQAEKGKQQQQQGSGDGGGTSHQQV